MITENHAKGKISWPENRRMTVAITFDFQGGEPVRPLANGKMNNEDYAEGEYGPKTGIWRILRMLDEVKVKTTFLTCGGIAERYPDAIKAIAEQGHGQRSYFCQSHGPACPRYQNGKATQS